MMEYFFAEPGRIRHLIEKRHLYLFFDYDGTLTPIAQRPQEAELSIEARELLRTLSKTDRCEVAIVSGRAVSHVKKLVGLGNITYVGNHGMEIECPNLNFMPSMPTGYKNDLKRISEVLHETFAQTDGVIIEDKGYSISLHYRLVKPNIRDSVKARFEKAVSSYVQKKQISVRHGKKVLEVRPSSDWDKGQAVLWLLEKKHASPSNVEQMFPIYIGDDLTDEDAFSAMKGSGLAIVVGYSEHSEAEYYVNDIAEVVEFLRWILETVKTE